MFWMFNRCVLLLAVCLLIQTMSRLLLMLAGVQLAKMTPFRSYCVTTVSSLTSTIAFGMGLYGGMTSYINVRLVCRQLLTLLLTGMCSAWRCSKCGLKQSIFTQLACTSDSMNLHIHIVYHTRQVQLLHMLHNMMYECPQ